MLTLAADHVVDGYYDTIDFNGLHGDLEAKRDAERAEVNRRAEGAGGFMARLNAARNALSSGNDKCIILQDLLALKADLNEDAPENVPASPGWKKIFAEMLMTIAENQGYQLSSNRYTSWSSGDWDWPVFDGSDFADKLNALFD